MYRLIYSVITVLIGGSLWWLFRSVPRTNYYFQGPVKWLLLGIVIVLFFWCFNQARKVYKSYRFLKEDVKVKKKLSWKVVIKKILHHNKKRLIILGSSFLALAVAGVYAFASFLLPVLALPTVTSNGASAISQTAATLSGTIGQLDAFKALSERGFEYGKTTSYGSTATEQLPKIPNFIEDIGGNLLAPGKLNRPLAITRDTNDNIYVYDSLHYRIQKFDSSGVYIKQWGDGYTGNGNFSYDNLYSLGNLASDSENNIYLTDQGNHRVIKYSSDGDYILQWGTNGTANGQFNAPSGIAIDSANNVYVSDLLNNRIQKFDSSGVYQTKWGTSGSANGQLSTPMGLTVDTEDYVYVADSGNRRIQKFDSSGVYQTKWGSSGTGDGQFSNLTHSVYADSSNQIYATDSLNNRIQKFSSTGVFIAKWGTSGTGNGQFSQPMGITVDSSGDVYATDSNNHRVQKFDSNGVFMQQIGTPYNATDESSSISAAGYTAIDSDGNWFIADYLLNKIQKFSSSGDLLFEWGSTGSANGQFSSIGEIALDSNDNIYVADTGNYRIQKFDNDGNFILKIGKTVCPCWGSGNGQFNSISNIAIDEFDNLFVLEGNPNYRIQKFDSGGNYVTQWSIPSTSRTLTVVNGTLYVGAGTAYDGIQRYDLNGTALPELSTTFVNPDDNSRYYVVTGVNSIFRDPEGYYYLSGWLYDLTFPGGNPLYSIIDTPLIKISPDWEFVTAWGSQGTDPEDFYPSNLGYPNGSFAAFDSATGRFITTNSSPWGSGYKTFRYQHDGDYSLNITDLECGTTYHYRAFYRDGETEVHGADDTFQTAACDVSVQSTDLSITQSLLNTPPVISGQTVSYKITITNNGPNPVVPAAPDGSAVNLIFMTALPNNFSYTDVSSDDITCNNLSPSEYSLTNSNGHNHLVCSYVMGPGHSTPTVTINPSESLEITITGTATSDFVSSVTQIRSLLLYYQVFDDDQLDPLALDSDLASLPYASNFNLETVSAGNNLHTLTYSYTPPDEDPEDTPLPTDLAASITLVSPKPVKDGDDVEFSVNLQNKGPNSYIGDIFMVVVPAEVDITSVSAPYVCQEDDIGAYYPIYLQSFYPGRKILVCGEFASTTEIGIGSRTISLFGTATSNFVPGTSSMKVLYLDRSTNPASGDVDARTAVNTAIDNEQDLFGLDIDNVATWIYSYTAPPVDPIPEDPVPPKIPGSTTTSTTTTRPPTNPVTPVNPNSPPLFVGLTQPEKFTFGLSKGARVAQARFGYRNFAYFFLSLLLLLALLYALQARREYRRKQDLIRLLQYYQQLSQDVVAFLHITGHYLSTPLTVMKTSLELLNSQKTLPESISNGISQKLQKFADYASQISSESRSLLMGNQVKAQTTVSSDRYRLLQTLKERKVWLPLILVAVSLAALDTTAMLTNAYASSQLRFWNQVALFFLGAILTVIFVHFQRSQRAVATFKQHIVFEERTLHEQHQRYLSTVGHQIHEYYADLKKLSKDITLNHKTQLFMNGLEELNVVQASLFRASTFLTIHDNAPQVTLSQAYASVIEDYKDALKTKDMHIVGKVDNRLSLSAPVDEVYYLFSSLIDNAIKFSPDTSTILIRAYQNRKGLVLKVTNEGSHMSKAVQTKLFKPFVRGTSLETFNFEGMGLGLYTLKVLVDKYGGTVRLENRRGNNGVEACLTLPIHMQQEAAGQFTRIIQPTNIESSGVQK